MEFIANASIIVVGSMIIVSAMIFHLILMAAVLVARVGGVMP